MSHLAGDTGGFSPMARKLRLAAGNQASINGKYPALRFKRA
jgi:hypothetical protein